jgi:hypothetical protein
MVEVHVLYLWHLLQENYAELLYCSPKQLHSFTLSVTFTQLADWLPQSVVTVHKTFWQENQKIRYYL